MEYIKLIKKNIFEYNPKGIKLDLSHFLDFNNRIEYEKNGYLICKEVVSQNSINVINDSYNLLKNSSSFYELDGFATSIFYNNEIQKIIHSNLANITIEILSRIFDLKKIHHNLLNCLVLKFNKDKNNFFAHQDVPYVDEYESYTSFIWLPTEDINEDNGAMLVLPKSHKNFRWQKTHNQTLTPLSNINKKLIDLMVPIYIKKGDVLIFDNSLIHASMPNKTNKVRVAVNTGIAPISSKLIHYEFKNHSNILIKKYKVDKSFWNDLKFKEFDKYKNEYKNIAYEFQRCRNHIEYEKFLGYL